MESSLFWRFYARFQIIVGGKNSGLNWRRAALGDQGTVAGANPIGNCMNSFAVTDGG